MRLDRSVYPTFAFIGELKIAENQSATNGVSLSYHEPV